MVQVSASLLAADFARLGREVIRAEHAGVNSFHFDMMDGHYVPNIALAPDHLAALRPYTHLPFQIHLELANPNEVLEHFRPLEAELIIVCRDSVADPGETFARIRTKGAKTGLSLNPDEPMEETYRFLPELDLLLIMGVFPGFGGQNMQSNTITRIAQARQISRSMRLPLLIAVDGGINLENASALVKAGADMLIIGTALFHAPKMRKFMAKLKEAVEVKRFR
ncbi:MAG: ribulose-phosphate 3-epimerase [Anaerolineales bacterium]